MKKLVLLSLCWAGIVPAVELKKEPSTYEQAIALLLSKSQKLGYFDLLPDETLDHIVQYLIGNVAHARSEEELQESVQAITRLQTTCYRFNNLLQGDRYQKELKVSLKIALTSLRFFSDKESVFKASNFGFICNALTKLGFEDKPMHDNSTFLHIAAIKGLHGVVKNLLNTDTSNIDLAIDSYSSGIFVAFTPLTFAIIENHVATVRVLIETDANLDKRGNYQNTPLMLASACGYTQIVELLIKANADTSLKNEHGKTALDIAKEKGHTEIVELLENAQAQFHQPSRNE